MKKTSSNIFRGRSEGCGWKKGVGGGEGGEGGGDGGGPKQGSHQEP